MRNQCIPTTTEDTNECLIVEVISPTYGEWFTLIDAADAALIENVSLYLSRRKDTFYVKAYVRKVGTRTLLHRLILGVTDSDIHIDHINGDPLDNRRENLRVATRQENMFNRRPDRHTSSQYKGVSWERRARRWRSELRTNGVTHFLGRFASEEDAARAYDAAARDLFGEYAYLNFPEVDR